MPKPMKTAPANKSSDYVVYEEGKHWNSAPDGEKEVRFAETGVASKNVTPAKTLIEIFEIAAKKKGKYAALRTENMNSLEKGQAVPAAKPLSKWKTWTWAQYLADVKLAARGFMKLGMEQHDAVNIFGFNSPEWALSQFAAIFAGGKAAGIYPSDTADQVQFKSFHSNACVAVVENEACKEKFLAVIDDLPYLKAIVCWACKPGDDVKRSDGTTVKMLSWKGLMELGGNVPEDELKERIKLIKPTHACGLIYTSGTTGRPKAVMISHDNIAFEANSVLPLTGVGARAEEERIISYLPLSHVAGLLFDLVAPLVISCYKKGWVSTNFARAYDLKSGTIGQRLVAIEPTVFLGVPRVWEKIAEKLQAIGAQTKGLKKKLSTAAKKKGLQAQINQQLGGNGKTPFMYGVYSKLLKVIKTKLGLAKCKFALAGAAPMTRETLSYFGSLGINVNEVYGMSECTAATTASTDAAHEWGTVGFEIPGAEVRCFKVAEGGELTECPKAKNILQPSEDEQGELCYRGRHVMIGYMANPKLGEEHVEEINQKNADAIDKWGWLHSGDKGAISSRGMIRITGRYKELIIGAGGENIAPVPIEDSMKALCPFISNVMMVGDKRKFNIMLISLKCVGATGELAGSDKLDGAATSWGKTIQDAVNNKACIAAITKALKDTGNDGSVTPSNAAKVQKFGILPEDFSVAGEELTATLKLKRSVAEKKYSDYIEAIYESKDTFVPYSVVGAYGDKSKGPLEPAGSFKTNEPLSMVDDSDVETIQKAEAAELEGGPEAVQA